MIPFAQERAWYSAATQESEIGTFTILAITPK
jgi:hypothetical protein